MGRISVCELADWQAAQRRFTLLDVRREVARTNAGAELPGATWRRPEDLFTWKDDIARDRPVVVVCAHGHEISQGVAGTLRAMGLDARYLIDGFAGWVEAGQPTVALASSS
ncbi:MAG TPA: rhodanese-like domain-containing protein [Burkholderiaceae bacterium]|nr:rhodanese-like domain-containing protein [Burkholderiaceae bacterium]